MKILFKGSVPQEKSYSYSVKNNNNSNVITFELDKIQEDDLDLSSLTCFVKVKGAIIDKDVVSKSVEGDKLKIKWIMKRKHTKSRIISIQLQFEGYGESDIVWQTEIVEITLSNTINADESIENEFPGELADHEERIQALEKGITKDTYSREVIDQKIHESEEEMREEIHQSKDIIVGNPDAYISESGVDKIIRKREKDGSVVESYVVDKIVYPSTLVKCEQHRETNNYDYNAEWEDFINDLGHDDFYAIFGEYCVIDGSDTLNIYSLYYNQNNEEIKGIVLGNINNIGEYGAFTMIDCTPNKEITIVVGKYFKYDERGNKVFDQEDANLWCEQVVGNEGNSINPITEERQEFKIRTDSSGQLYFDSDASGTTDNNRFILYEIRSGEPEHVEYKKKLIGSNTGSGSNKFIELELEKGEIVYNVYNFYEDEYLDESVLLHDLHIKLHNFTEEDIGKYIYIYRRTGNGSGNTRNRKYIHPSNWDSEVTNIQKLGYACLANTPYSKAAEQVIYRPDVPYWMPNNGAVKTEIQITREDINRGYIKIKLCKELLSVIYGILNQYLISFDLEADVAPRLLGQTIKLKFGIVDSNKLVYLSHQILKINFARSQTKLGQMLIRLENGDIVLRNKAPDENTYFLNVGLE